VAIVVEQVDEDHAGTPLIQSRTYAKLQAVEAIHELPLRETKGFGYCLRKSCKEEILFV
jgi:hypothetical protein